MPYFHLSNNISIQSRTIVQVYCIDIAVVSFLIWLIVSIMYFEKILVDHVDHTCCGFSQVWPENVDINMKHINSIDTLYILCLRAFYLKQQFIREMSFLYLILTHHVILRLGKYYRILTPNFIGKSHLFHIRDYKKTWCHFKYNDLDIVTLDEPLVLSAEGDIWCHFLGQVLMAITFCMGTFLVQYMAVWLGWQTWSVD